jgi:hypothetical protein
MSHLHKNIYIVTCYAAEDAVQIVNWFIYNLTLTIIYSAVSQLTILHANISFPRSLHNTLQIKPSHFETDSANSLLKTVCCRELCAVQVKSKSHCD